MGTDYWIEFSALFLLLESVFAFFIPIAYNIKCYIFLPQHAIYKITSN